MRDDVLISQSSPIRYATPAHDPQMRPVIQRLWDETMTEFEFAGAQKILEDMQSENGTD